MTLDELASTLRMMGWIPIGAGFMFPPENYRPNETVLLAGEDEVLINIAVPHYYTNEEALKHILENTDE